MTTAAHHDRDQASARVTRLRRDLQAKLTSTGGLAGAERTAAVDELVATTQLLLTTEVAVEDAEKRVVRAQLEARHAATQHMAVYFAIIPVLVAMAVGAMVLFEAVGAFWLLPAIPLGAAGLRIAFGPVRPTAEAIRERRQAAGAGAGAGILTALALVPWASTAVTAALAILAVLAAVGTVALLVHESRITGEPE